MDLSAEEQALLKQLLERAKPTKVAEPIDINAPRRDPYKYQEYPRMVYHHGERKHKAVNSDAELEALGAEWKKEPYERFGEDIPAPAPVSTPEKQPEAAKGKKSKPVSE